MAVCLREWTGEPPFVPVVCGRTYWSGPAPKAGLRRRRHSVRARRSCLSVPGSSPKFLAKAAGLPADEVFFDLEDSVAPLEKEAARGNIIEALKNNTFQAPTKIVRINGVYTRWAYRDIIEIVETAGDLIDGLMIPKVETPNDVTFVADLLRMIEETTGLNKKLGLEV